MFYGDIKLILEKRKITSAMFYGEYKTDFGDDKITSAMFYGDLKLILTKRNFNKQAACNADQDINNI